MEIQKNRLQSFCLLTLTFIALTAALMAIRGILIPFLLAFFFYAVFSPVVDFLKTKFKLPHFLSVLICVLGFSLSLVLIVLLVFHSLKDFLTEAQTYRSYLEKLLVSFPVPIESFSAFLKSEAFLNSFSKIPISSWAASFTQMIVSLISNTFLIFIFFLFLISSPSTTHKLVLDIERKISSYVATKLFVSVLTGALFGLTFWIFNLELAFLFAVLALVLNFIPNVGSILATVLPIPILFLQFEWGAFFWLVLGILFLIQMIVGNVLEPKLLGNSMDLHPITILLFLMFWGYVLGLTGMFLAIPITAILKIILSRTPETHKLSELLAGRLSS